MLVTLNFLWLQNFLFKFFNMEDNYIDPYTVNPYTVELKTFPSPKGKSPVSLESTASESSKSSTEKSKPSLEVSKPLASSLPRKPERPSLNLFSTESLTTDMTNLRIYFFLIARSWSICSSIHSSCHFGFFCRI
jgi:hypothetical protein